MTRIVQRLMCTALLVGCLVVSAAQKAPQYAGWTVFWTVTTVLITAVFVVQTLQERRQ